MGYGICIAGGRTNTRKSLPEKLKRVFLSNVMIDIHQQYRDTWDTLKHLSGLSYGCCSPTMYPDEDSLGSYPTEQCRHCPAALPAAWESMENNWV